MRGENFKEVVEKFDVLIADVIAKSMTRCTHNSDPKSLYLGTKEVEIMSNYFTQYFDMIEIDVKLSMLHGLQVFVVDANSHLEVF